MHWQIEPMDVVDSTNDVAHDWILASWARGQSAAGLVITAQKQRGGRGQHGRTWESPPGGLYMSAVVEEVPLDCRDRLALVAGAAAIDALKDPRTFFDEADARTASPILVRWPNDLVVPAQTHAPGQLPHRKIGGILCESVAMGDRFASIIGIGINVATALDALPAPMHARATSLVEHDGLLRTVTGVLDALLASLSDAMHWLTTEGIAGAVQRLQAVDALKGRRIALELDAQHIEGLCRGLSPTGQLLLETPGGLQQLDRGSILSIEGTPTRA